MGRNEPRRDRAKSVSIVIFELNEMLVIIPALNEEDSIASVIADTKSAFPQSDVLVIDDGSTDGTRRAAAMAGASVLSLCENVGIGGAVQAGYMWAVRADADVVLRIDGDGQHDPLEAKTLVEAVVSGDADVAVGSRFLDSASSAFRSTALRRVGIRLFSRILGALIGQKVTDPTSGLRCVNGATARFSASHHPHDFPEIESLVHYHREGLRIVEFPVDMRARVEGRSSISGLRSAYYVAKVSLALFVLAIERRRK